MNIHHYFFVFKLNSLINQRQYYMAKNESDIGHEVVDDLAQQYNTFTI